MVTIYKTLNNQIITKILKFEPENLSKETFYIGVDQLLKPKDVYVDPTTKERIKTYFQENKCTHIPEMTVQNLIKEYDNSTNKRKQ